MKTLKLRIFPTNDEQDKLKLILQQFRWYYNFTVNVVNDYYKKLDNPKYSSIEIRDLVRKYEYLETEVDGVIEKKLNYNESRNEVIVPTWWLNDSKLKVHSRIPRGASEKYTSSLNSAISNLKNGNITKFEMKPMTKKNPTSYASFEDKSYPAFIKKIKSRYWFSTKDRKRQTVSLLDIIKSGQDRGLEIIHEKLTNKYFIHIPVERNWFPSDDKRIDDQNKFKFEDSRVIALDPGVRKFMVGYDPNGEAVFIGKNASKALTVLLLTLDKLPNPYFQWKKIKNMVAELHWKTANFLVKNYDHILLPDFRISQMVKGKKLGRMTKRLLYMFSFHQFKERLTFKCKEFGKKLYIVNESYTSCTCGICGKINNIGCNEVVCCPICKIKMDRDVSGARNIFIKNASLR